MNLTTSSGGDLFLKTASFEIRHNYDLVLNAVNIQGLNLKYAAHAFRDNYNIVLAAVAQNGWALEFASERLRDNYGIVMAAVLNCGSALLYASPRCNRDRNIVMTAMKSSGYALKYVNQIFLTDREIIMAAVKNDGDALEHVPENFLNDREIVMTAISNCSIMFEFGTIFPLWSADRDIAIIAVRNNAGFKYINKALYDNPDFLAEVFNIEYKTPELFHEIMERGRCLFKIPLPKAVITLLLRLLIEAAVCSD